MSKGSRAREDGGSDEAIVGRMARRDEAALRELFRRYGPRIAGMLGLMTEDDALRRELLEDAFLVLWEAAPRFDSARASARSWVITLAHRRAVLRLRALQRLTSPTVQQEASGHYPASRAVANSELLPELDEDSRELVTAAFFGGMGGTGLASRLARPEPSVRAALRRGLIQLRQGGGHGV